MTLDISYDPQTKDWIVVKDDVVQSFGQDYNQAIAFLRDK